LWHEVEDDRKSIVVATGTETMIVEFRTGCKRDSSASTEIARRRPVSRSAAGSSFVSLSGQRDDTAWGSSI